MSKPEDQRMERSLYFVACRETLAVITKAVSSLHKGITGSLVRNPIHTHVVKHSGTVDLSVGDCLVH